MYNNYNDGPPVQNQPIPVQLHQAPIPTSNSHLTMFPLANEYLVTAHNMSWGLTSGCYDLGMYQKLVALGIACLYAVLEEQNLHPFVEIQTRLKLASLLMDETENYEEADRVLSKGIAVANKSNYYMLSFQLKYASIQAISGSNSKSALRLLQTSISEVQMMGPHVLATAYALRFLKISILLGSSTSHDYTQAIQELVDLESQRESQKQVACLACTIHALKLIQSGATQEARPLLAMAEEIENEVSRHIVEIQNAALAQQMQPPVIYPIVVQISMLRIVCQILLELEACQYESLERSITELGTLMGSPSLKVEGVWSKDGQFYLPLASLVNGNSGPESSMLQVHWITHAEGQILSFMISGIAKLRVAGENRVARQFLRDALRHIKAELAWKSTTDPNSNGGPPSSPVQEPPAPPIMSLTAAKQHKDQLRLLQCYTLFYLTIENFLLSYWSDPGYLQELLQTAQLLPPHMNEKFFPQTFYLSGVFFQASGNAHNAIQFYLKIRTHVLPGAELFILATINLILVLEAPEHVRYNTFQMIPLENERAKDHGGALTPSAVFRREIEPWCLSHASPLIRWAWELIDYAYNTLPNASSGRSGQSEEDQDSIKSSQSHTQSNGSNGTRDGGNELAIQNKLSLLLKYAMNLSSFQLGSIVAFLGVPRAEPKDRKIALAHKGLSDAYKSRDSLWSWMNGVALEVLFRQNGNIPLADKQLENNARLKKAVESRLNRVD